MTAKTFPQLCQALQMSGLSFVNLMRSPCRIGGVWYCEVSK